MPQSYNLGLSGGYGTAGFAEGLERALAEQLKRKIIERQEQQRLFENALNERKQREIERAAVAGEGFEGRRTKVGENADTRAAAADVRAATKAGQETADWIRGNTERGEADALISGIQNPNVRTIAGIQRRGGPTLTESSLQTPEERGRDESRKNISGWDFGLKRIFQEQQDIEGARQVEVAKAGARAPMPFIVQGPTGYEGINRSTMTSTPVTQAGTGQQLGQAPTSDQRNRQSARKAILPVFEAIDELSQRINTSQGAIALITGSVERAKAAANLSDDVSQYNALVSGFTPMIARAVGHVGVLTQPDVDSVKEALPKVTDSQTVRDRKINQIISIMNSQSGQVADLFGKKDTPSGNTVTMRAPDGSTMEVPESQVAHYQSKGAVVVKRQ